MPEETQQAVDWTLQQSYTDWMGIKHQVSKDSYSYVIVGYVREYFNNHDIQYGTFDWYDIEPYVEASEYN